MKLGKDLETNGYRLFLGRDEQVAIGNNEIINMSDNKTILGFGTDKNINCYNNINMNGWSINNASNLINTERISKIDMPSYASDRSYINLDFTTKADGTFRVQINTSDGRLKKNIADSEINALDTIEKIQHRQFNWKDSERFQELGYIAQEMEEVNENFVTKVEQTDEKGEIIDYLYQISDKDIIPYVTKAIQELNNKQKEYINIIEKQQKIIDLLVEKAGIDVSNINSNKKLKTKIKDKNKNPVYDEEIKLTKTKIREKKEKEYEFNPKKMIIDVKRNGDDSKWKR